MSDQTPQEEKDPFEVIAEIAAKRALEVEARKVRVHAIVTALVISLTISIVVAVVDITGRNSNNKANSAYNCNLLRNIATVDGAMISSDANLRIQSAKLNVLPKIIQDIVKVIPITDIQALESESLTLNEQTADYWKNQLLPLLEEYSNANCNGASQADRVSLPPAPGTVKIPPTSPAPPAKKAASSKGS